MVSAFYRSVTAGFFAVVGLVGLAPSAHADLTVCNKTAASVVFAIAFETSQDLVSQGWWTVTPGQCQVALSVPLDRQFYYHYAVSQELKVEWRGNFNFCTSDDPQFRISGAQSCEQRNYRTTGFRQLDVGTNRDYVLNILNGAPAPAPAAAAPGALPPVGAKPPVPQPSAQQPLSQTPGSVAPAAPPALQPSPAAMAPASPPVAVPPVVAPVAPAQVAPVPVVPVPSVPAAPAVPAH